MIENFCHKFAGHSQIVGILLDNGADYTSSDSNGATPLHYAAQNNYFVSAELNQFRKTQLRDIVKFNPLFLIQQF